MIRALAFDIDGTLCLKNNEIEQDLRDSLQALLRQGKSLWLATGRPVPDLDMFRQKNDFFVPAVVLNGAMVYEDQCVHSFETMPEGSVSKIMDIFQRNKRSFICYMKDRTYKWTGTRRYEDIMQSRLTSETDLDALFNSFVSMDENFDSAQVLKMEACFEEDGSMEALRKELVSVEGVHVVSSMGFNLEVTSLSANKGSKLKQVLMQRGFAEEEVMVFGDSENDVPMFEHFSHSVLVRNPRRPVSYPVKHIIEHRELASFLNHLDEKG